MLKNTPQNRAVARFALLGLGILGIVTSLTGYLLYSSSKKPLVTPVECKAPVENKITVLVDESRPGDKKTIVEEKMGTEATVISVEEVAPAQPAATTASRMVRPRPSQSLAKASHVPARRASAPDKFPPPSGTEDWITPRSEVEMWSGTRKKVVFVPHGAKFE